MQLTKIEKNGITCAVVNSNEIVITDAQSALDVLMSAKYDIGTENIVVDRKLLPAECHLYHRGLRVPFMYGVAFFTRLYLKRRPTWKTD